MTTTLTGKNQVTIPVGISRAMGLEVGSGLEWTIGPEPGMIIIRVQPSRQQKLARIRQLGEAYRGLDLPGQLEQDRADAE
jgi:bifunctional DNA-binding transcriptional regulator/antitoxin component of YhaV-PrlF toxin-antitoxin module